MGAWVCDSPPVELASNLVHEAQHHEDWWGCRTVWGLQAEGRALERQAEFLDRVGETALAAQYRGLIGVHGQAYEQWKGIVREGCVEVHGPR